MLNFYLLKEPIHLLLGIENWPCIDFDQPWNVESEWPSTDFVAKNKHAMYGGGLEK